MNTCLLPLVRNLAVSLAALVVLALGQGAVRADEVTVAGSTGGCFGAACSPGGTGQSQTASLLGLTYNGAAFNTTTSSGFSALGSNANPGANFNNLGSFTLTGDPNSYNGQSFSLVVTFTAPAGITGGNPATFQATLVGSVSSNNNGGVSVIFSNPSQTFSFSGPNGTGSFTFNVTNFDINAGQTSALHGNLTGSASSVPEPASLLLFGTGLTGLAVGLRKRYRSRT